MRKRDETEITFNFEKKKNANLIDTQGCKRLQNFETFLNIFCIHVIGDFTRNFGNLKTLKILYMSAVYEV